MKAMIGRKKIIKAAILGLMISVMCILTFICVTPVYANATEAESVLDNNNNNDNSNNSTNVSNSNESTDDGNNTLEGNLGGLTFQFSGDDNSSLAAALQILLVLTVIALAPSILIMLTSFTRIVIVLHFVRTALGTQTTPPNQILIGLSLFLTFFIMSPVFIKVNEVAIQPLSDGTISAEQAFEEGIVPIREFMFEQMEGSEKDLELFLEIAGIEEVNSRDDIPTLVLIPAFIVSELRIAFIIGFLIYIPFLIIDMVVASTLMSMGMMMLPPTTISMPFKILLFIVADGWDLIIGQVVKTFF